MDPDESIQRRKTIETLKEKISEYNRGLRVDDVGGSVDFNTFRSAAVMYVYGNSPSLLLNYLKLVGIKDDTGLHLNCIEALLHLIKNDSTSTNQVIIRNTINPPTQVKTLLTHGVPKLGTITMGGGGSSQSRSHAEARLISAKFCLIEDLEQYILSDKGSELYRDLANRKYRNYVYEHDLNHIIIKVLDELILDLNQQSTLTIVSERGFFSSRTLPDYWVLHRITPELRLYPLGVIEIKPSPFPHDMSHIYGQMYDYLLRLSSFSGLYPVFGIITNYEEWIICWLGEENSGESTKLQQNNTKDKEEPPKQSERFLYGKSYKREDKDLVSALLSVLLRMVNSRRYKLERFSATRSYPVINHRIGGANWNWEGGVKWSSEKPCKTTMPNDHQAIYLIKDLEGGNGRVWLGCDKDKNHCVLKFFGGSEEANREVRMWNDVNRKTLRKLKLYVTVGELQEDIYYVKMPYVKTLSRAPSTELVLKLKSVISGMAMRGYCQRDVKWEHFGTVGGVVVALDFGLVERCTEHKATEQMNKWIDEQLGSGAC